MTNNKNKFTGVFIPKEFFNLEISWFERILLSSILHLSDKRPCTMSNTQFAEALKTNDSQVSRAIKNLNKKGLIVIEKPFAKNSPVRNISIDKMQIQVLTKCQQSIDKMQKQYYQNVNESIDKMSNNIITLNNKENNNNIIDQQTENSENLEQEKIPLFLKAQKEVEKHFNGARSTKSLVIETAKFEGTETEFNEELTRYFSHYSDNTFLLNKFIQNPFAMSGKLIVWFSRAKAFKKNNPKNKTFKNGLEPEAKERFSSIRDHISKNWNNV